MKKKTKKTKKKTYSLYKLILTALITALSVGGICLIIYAWNLFGFSSHEVYYTSDSSNIIGSFPASRKFRPGDEVVVRAGSISRRNYRFIGWKDKNNVIENSGGIFEGGHVFIMPDGDVCFEAVWEEINPNNDDPDTPSSPQSSEPLIFNKVKNKDYINLRSSCDYNGEVLAEISDSDIDIEYYGKSQSIYDESSETVYIWYFVKIPSLNEEGWIRSDMLEEVN